MHLALLDEVIELNKHNEYNYSKESKEADNIETKAALKSLVKDTDTLLKRIDND